MQNSSSQTLYDLLITHDFEPEALDAAGKSTGDIENAKMFSFDFKTPTKNYGTVVILIGPENDLQLFASDNIGKTMEGDDKKQWFDFIQQLKPFAIRNNFSGFSIQNINRLKYTMQGMAAIKEGLFEGYYGNRSFSYSDQPKKTRLVIKHSRPLGETDARHHNIDSLYVETEDGSRYRLPHRNLSAGKAMARHCAEGGNPHDAFGQHINSLVTELATLGRFIRAARGREFDGPAAELVETAIRHYGALKNKAKQMISQRGYYESRDNFDPAAISDRELAVESIRNMFIEQSVDQRIEEALPILARLQTPDEPAMREADEFESWAAGITEGTWALPDAPDTQQQLKKLMSEPLIVGPDATNATEQLYNLVGDDELFDILSDIAAQNPNANAWENPEVMNRLTELGVDVPGGDEQNPDQPIDPGAADTPPEDAMGEDLDTDGVMMTQASNMSSESREVNSEFTRLMELLKH